MSGRVPLIRDSQFTRATARRPKLLTSPYSYHLGGIILHIVSNPLEMVDSRGMQIDFELREGHVENVTFACIIIRSDVVRDGAFYQTRRKFGKSTSN